MAEVVRLRSDKDALEAFVVAAGIERSESESQNKKWITLAAVSFVTHNKQLAWKGARVLEYLYDTKKVPLNKLASRIRNQGGIEKIVKIAAEEDPRHRKDPGGVKKGSKTIPAPKKNPFKSANAGKERAGDDADGAKDWDEPRDEENPSGGDDQITVRISSALSAKLLAIKPKRRVKVIGMRVDKEDWSDIVLEVQDVRRLKD
jgi:hypothetical protein